MDKRLDRAETLRAGNRTWAAQVFTQDGTPSFVLVEDNRSTPAHRKLGRPTGFASGMFASRAQMLLIRHNPELNLSRYVQSLSSKEMSATPNTIALGDGSLILELPEPFSMETEDDGTICAFLIDLPEMLAVRFSSITVEAKAPKRTKDLDLATDTLARGKKKNRETGQVGDKAWYHEDQDSEQDGRPIWIRFWHVGCRNSQIIISLCCDAEAKEHAQVLETLVLVPKLIAGLKWRGEKSPLTPRESELLDEQRALVEEALRTRYDSYALPKLKADLPALQRLVDDRLFSPEQEHEWSCVGVVFGDIIANELGLDWIVQCDEYGVEPALNLKNTSITLFPRSMILKRVEQGEFPDLQYLLGELAESVEELKREGC